MKEVAFVEEGEEFGVEICVVIGRVSIDQVEGLALLVQLFESKADIVGKESCLGLEMESGDVIANATDSFFVGFYKGSMGSTAA